MQINYRPTSCPSNGTIGNRGENPVSINNRFGLDAHPLVIQPLFLYFSTGFM